MSKIETIENNYETTENTPATFVDVAHVLRDAVNTIRRFEITTTKIDLSQIPEYTVIQTMLKTNPNLDISAACKLLNVSEDNTKKIIEVINYYEERESCIDSIESLMSELKSEIISKGIVRGATTRTRAPSTSTGQRKKICGKFFGKCPTCDYVARGKERSLVTNQIKLHMMKEHRLTLEEFNELYRNTVNNSIECDGETWVEYY